MNKIFYLYLLLLSFFFQSICIAQQKNNLSRQTPLFELYQNDTLASSDVRLLENPSRNFNSKEILTCKIKWINPYPVVKNNQMEGFDYSKIGKVSPKGIYPRIFTSPDEFSDIKARLLNSKIGLQLLNIANQEIDKLNSGIGEFGRVYQSLLLNDSVNLDSNFPYTDFANQLAIKALLEELNNDKQDVIKTAKAAGNFLQIWIRFVDSIPHFPGRELMVKEQVYSHASMAKLFDFTARRMSALHKKIYFSFMLHETTGKYGDGMQLPHHWRRWNHIASALAYPLSILSIETEKGYDKRIYDRGLEVLQDYLTYTFSPEGMSNEGITYTFGPFADDLLLMAAVAKRGQPNFWGHPHFRKIPDWLLHSLSPNPNALWSSHGDTGSASDLPWLIPMIMKNYYPKDEKIDYLLANALPQNLAKLPDVSAFVFVTDASKTKEEYNGIPPTKLPLTFFSEQRGSFITRNKWDKNGIQFQLDGRQDMYFQSHDHSDRGNFELASHGRLWVVDGWRSTESKYHSVITIDGRGQGYFGTPAAWLNYIDTSKATFGLINQKYAYDWMWIKSPVADILSGKKVQSQWQSGVYAEAAKSLKKYYPNAKPERDPLKKVAEYFSGNLSTNPLIWNEDTWPMRLPNYNVEYAFRTAGLVKGKHDYVLIVDDIKKDNQEHLYEWLMPMPLDVEVVSINQLVEVKQESSPLNIGFNTLTNKGIQGEYDILLGDKRMKRNMKDVDNSSGELMYAGRFTPKPGDPQLLVRVLNRTAAPRPNLEPSPRLEVIEKLKTEDMHQFYLRTMDIGKRLVIPSRSAQPDFKVLLFPHLSGEKLPNTKWNEDKSILKVEFIDQIDIFYFTKTNNGRTGVKLVRDNEIIFSF